ncbi:YcaO-like family protein [Mesorhizobium sp. M0761]|uniref:YcaO-like family protein n=1 Tax=Mesorhizobium sp. M0761 TaxID=2956994 RepID=UPI003338097D
MALAEADEFAIIGNPRICRSKATIKAALRLATAAGITRVADISGLDDLALCVVSIVRPNSASLSVSSGKGLDIQSACVSGLMEALELYHAETFAEWIPFAEIPDGVHVPPLAALPKASLRGTQPSRWPRMSIGWDIVSGKVTAVPFDLVHADFTTEASSQGDGFIVSSNGLGGGVCYSAAVIHGLCEVIEGDAIAIFQASRPERYSQILWDTVLDPGTRLLYQACSIAGIDAVAWDIRTELGVPTYYVRLVESRKDPPTLIQSATDGSSSHLNAEVALRGALMEAIQTRLMLISGARDDIRPRSYVNGPGNSIQCREVVPFPAESASQQMTDDEAVGRLVEQVVRAGFPQVVVVDLQSMAKELSFVRVVVPGLEAYPHSVDYSPGSRALAGLNE